MSYFDQFDLKSLANLDLLARQVVEGFIIGLHKSPYHGFSVEFAEHRHYNQGESTKGIDWKVYARTDKLFSKKYEEETNLRCQIVIDASSSMFYPEHQVTSTDRINKFQFSALGAASLINLLRKQRDAFGLSMFDDEIIHHFRPKSSTAQNKLLLTYLEKLINQPPVLKTTAAAKALHRIADRIHKRSMVVIFTDMIDHAAKLDDLFSALNHLKFNKHEIVLFHVVHKSSEIDFEFQNRPYEFIDLETGSKVKLQPNEVKAQYIKRMSDFTSTVKMKCLQFKIDYIQADIKEGYFPILKNFLLKRSKMNV
jgi:uncharacterized protein (DUF58 family)